MRQPQDVKLSNGSPRFKVCVRPTSDDSKWFYVTTIDRGRPGMDYTMRVRTEETAKRAGWLRAKQIIDGEDNVARWLARIAA